MPIRLVHIPNLYSISVSWRFSPFLNLSEFLKKNFNHTRYRDYTLPVDSASASSHYSASMPYSLSLTRRAVAVGECPPRRRRGESQNSQKREKPENQESKSSPLGWDYFPVPVSSSVSGSRLSRPSSVFPTALPALSYFDALAGSNVPRASGRARAPAPRRRRKDFSI